MIVREKDDPSLYRAIQERNLVRQYSLLDDSIGIGLDRGIESFDKYSLWALNHIAVANIIEHGGRYRQEPIYVGSHIPPYYREIPELMDRFFSFVHENWTLTAFDTHPTMLAAYALWRINWIHPFVEGNGRTARAACYYLICLKQGKILPGRKIVPERIRENREPYYRALEVADRAWNDGHYGLEMLADYLQALLRDQLREL